MATVAEKLASFALASGTTSLPPEVRSAVVRHVLDQAAVQLDGCDRPAVTLIAEYAESRARTGKSVVVGRARRLEPTWAALVNAASATAFENDDYHPAGLIHAYSAVVPAVLAYGDELGSGLEECLRAIAVGVEAATRISIAGQPGMNHGRGIHPTSAVAPFGVALAVGLLLELDEQRLAQAIGICGSFAGGVLEYSLSGGQVKRLHTGLAAEAGIRAAELAGAGLDGPLTVVEGPRGVLSAFSDSFDPVRHVPQIVDDVGTRWELLGTAVKPYFTNGLIQGPIWHVRNLLDRHGLSVDEIERIELGVDAMAASVCAPTELPPRDLIDAQFSLPFGVALAAVTGGSTLAAYQAAEAAGFDLPDVTSLARRIEVRVDPECDELFPTRFYSKVTIIARNRVFHTEGDAPGTPENPLAAAELEDKVRSAFGRRYGAGPADAALRALADPAARVADLTSLLGHELPEPAAPSLHEQGARRP